MGLGLTVFVIPALCYRCLIKEGRDRNELLSVVELNPPIGKKCPYLCALFAARYSLARQTVSRSVRGDYYEKGISRI